MTHLPAPPPPYTPAVIQLWRQTGQSKTITVQGHSMQPLLRPGDRLTVSCGPTPFRRGDLVVFYHQQQLVVHRVVSLSRPAAGLILITKGDNTQRCDAPLTVDQVVGRVTHLHRGRRTVCLDRPAWRGINRLLAGLSLASARLIAAGSGLKRRVGGRRAGPIPPLIRLAPGRLLNLGLRLIGLIMGRS